MTTNAFLAPGPIQDTFFIPGGNIPGIGVQLGFLQDRTTTPQSVYTSSTGAVAWSNPIVLDSGGNLPSGGTVWLQQGLSYTVTYAPSSDTFPPIAPYRTLNDIIGINDPSSVQASGEWVAGTTPTFVAANQFTVATDLRSIYLIGRRIQATVTSGTVYGMVTNATFAVGLTTVTVTMDRNQPLDSGMSAVSYGLLTSVHSAIPWQQFNGGAPEGYAATTAALITTDLNLPPGNLILITSTVAAITNFTMQPGAFRFIQFSSSGIALNSSATLILPAGNMTTVAGDMAIAVGGPASTVTLAAYAGSSNPFFGAFAIQASSTVFAGPSTGAGSLPTFRNLVGAESGSRLLAIKIAAPSTIAMSFSSNEVNWTAYDEYEFHCLGFKTSINSAFAARFSNDGGNTFVSTASAYLNAVQGMTSVSTAIAAGGPQVNMFLSDLAVGQSQQANRGGNYRFTVFQPTNTTGPVMAQSEATFYQATGGPDIARVQGGFGYQAFTSAAVNGVQFLFLTGSTMAGTIRVYGVVNS